MSASFNPAPSISQEALEMGCLRAVFLDAFGTLLDAGGLHVEATERILAELGLKGHVRAGELHDEWDKHILAFLRERRFLRTWDIFLLSLERALNSFGMSLCLGELERAGVKAILIETFSKTRLHRGARDILAFCRSLGLKTGIISDADAFLLRSLLAKHGLTGLLDTVVISDEVGALKPDPEVFKRALQAVRCRAEEAMMVGDAKRDIEGAKEMGMWAALVLRPLRAPRALVIEPDIVVNSLAELKGPIAALS